MHMVSLQKTVNKGYVSENYVLFLFQTFNVALVGLELSVILVHFVTRRFLSIKHGTMLITRAKALAVIFSV